MTNTKDIIIKLKEVREEKKLSFQDIINLMEQNGDYIAKSTLSRVFSDGSEELHFKYDETIRPIANALLDIDHIEDDDVLDVIAMKTLLQYKDRRIKELEKQIQELETQISKEKNKYHEKLEKERDQHQRSVEFLKNQINLKDKRMDQLLEAVFTKDLQQQELLSKFLCCPCKTDKKIKGGIAYDMSKM